MQAHPIPRPADQLFDLTGRRALVTGAGRGIGLACAELLAAQGAAVTLLARSPKDLEAAVAGIQAAGGQAEALSVDATDLAAVTGWIADQPAFDILINNAGTNQPTPFTEVTVEQFDRIMQLNVRSAFFIAQAVVRKLLAEQRGGAIVQISSQMGHIGAANRTVYCASKHAIEGLTKAMAADLVGSGIRVNSLCPTFIETPLTRPFFDDPRFAAEVRSKILLGRVGQVEEVARAALFLASDAASLMQGSALMVDGGWTAV